STIYHTRITRSITSLFLVIADYQNNGDAIYIIGEAEGGFGCRPAHVYPQDNLFGRRLVLQIITDVNERHLGMVDHLPDELLMGLSGSGFECCVRLRHSDCLTLAPGRLAECRRLAAWRSPGRIRAHRFQRSEARPPGSSSFQATTSLNLPVR